MTAITDRPVATPRTGTARGASIVRQIADRRREEIASEIADVAVDTATTTS